MPDLMMNAHTCITETTAYWYHYLHNDVQCMSDSMINVDTYFTDSTTYTMLPFSSLREIQW
jgi:hypothetical protein